MANEKTLTEETAEVATESTTENVEAEVNTEASENSTEDEPAEDTAEDTEDEPAEDTEKKELVAVYPILFHSHQYEVGEILPTNYPDMVQAWLDAGTAVWKGATKAAPKAKPATAEPGQPGVAVASESENGDDLVGKVPKTTRRSKK